MRNEGGEKEGGRSHGLGLCDTLLSTSSSSSHAEGGDGQLSEQTTLQLCGLTSEYLRQVQIHLNFLGAIYKNHPF